MKIDELSFAKINLFLEVTGKRMGGYHNLETVFQEISLHDQISLVPSRQFQMDVLGATLPVDERNLALRAARSLADRISKKVQPVRIQLVKKIPIGGGLGGGSSNAASVLRGLCRMWRLSLNSRAVVETAKSLGADVPFFLKGGTALGRGIGDRLTVLPTPQFFAILVHPGVSVATSWAYRQLRFPLTGRQKVRKICTGLSRGSPRKWGGSLFNRFEEAVFPEYPRVLSAARALKFYGCEFVLMSGSGSCVFGIVNRESVAGTIHRRICRDGWNAWVVHSISRSSVRETSWRLQK